MHATASLMLISPVEDEEKSPEKSATRQWLLLLFLFAPIFAACVNVHRFCFLLVAFFQHWAFRGLHKLNMNITCVFRNC